MICTICTVLGKSNLKISLFPGREFQHGIPNNPVLGKRVRNKKWIHMCYCELDAVQNRLTGDQNTCWQVWFSLDSSHQCVLLSPACLCRQMRVCTGHLSKYYQWGPTTTIHGVCPLKTGNQYRVKQDAKYVKWVCWLRSCFARPLFLTFLQNSVLKKYCF